MIEPAPERIPEPTPAGSRTPADRLKPRGLAPIGKAEMFAAASLTAVVVVFHLLRWFKAGGLWRDEAASAHLAANFSFSYVIGNSQYELFPALHPALVHVYGWIAGNSDSALRFFGLAVGLSIIGALFWNVRRIRGGFPLLGLALLGFNVTVVQWGDAVRGYGLGMLFIMLTAGAVWRMVERPTPARIALAAVFAVASVQSLFTNAVLVLAICLGAIALSIKRGTEQRAALALGVGLVAALSLLPYWKPLHHVREWDMLVRSTVTVESLCFKFGEALSSSGWWNAVIWVLLAVFGLVVCTIGQSKRTLHLRREDRDLLFFCGIVFLAAVAGYCAFLKTASVPTRPWYYLALIGLAALLLDLVFDTLKQFPWVRWARLGLVTTIALASLWPTWAGARMRQTNMDLVAARLRESAGPNDLIVIAPWYNGISFDRYYHGPARWSSVPPLEFHKFHRYDLVKRLMIMPDQNEPIKPVLDQIAETLKNGHRVWIVGVKEFPKPGQPIPTISAAPDRQWGWHDEPYANIWAGMAAAYLQASARHKEDVVLPSVGKVNQYEDVPLAVFDGWWGTGDSSRNR